MGSTETNQISLCLAGTDDFSRRPEPRQGIRFPARQGSEQPCKWRVLPPGEIGEIAVRTRYLSAGYWRQPELTAEKFLPDPTDADVRTYLTGDLGRMLPDGFLIHMGRKDLMVKIRGYRVEIGEIERALVAHPLIKDAGVVAWDRAQAEKYLVGYVIARSRSVLTVSELRAFLASHLPDYMIPSTFVFLESLPLTNGKLDRARLPVPDHGRPELAARYVAPRSELERRLVEIWEEILDVCPVGVDDDFFDLGGYSLLGAKKLIEEIKNAFQAELPLPLLGEQPTIAQLAAHIALVRGGQFAPWEQKQAYRYLVRLQSAPAKTPVFCLSHAGNYRGDLLRFAQLNRLIGAPYCFYGIQARGANGASEPHGSVEEMAAAYVEEIQHSTLTGSGLLSANAAQRPSPLTPRGSFRREAMSGVTHSSGCKRIRSFRAGILLAALCLVPLTFPGFAIHSTGQRNRRRCIDSQAKPGTPFSGTSLAGGRQAVGLRIFKFHRSD